MYSAIDIQAHNLILTRLIDDEIKSYAMRVAYMLLHVPHDLPGGCRSRAHSGAHPPHTRSE